MLEERLPPEVVTYAQEYTPVVSALSIILIGYIVEEHYVSRPALGANGSALSLYYLNFLIPNSGPLQSTLHTFGGHEITAWMVVELYVAVGFLVGAYGLFTYSVDSSNSTKFYTFSGYLYNSVLVGSVILVSFWFLN
jgi:hypothetical protein